MKIMSLFSRVALFSGLLSVLISCNSFDLDINKDPNNPTEASPALLLGNCQLNMAYGLMTLNDNAAGFMNQQYTYNNWNMSQGDFNLTWQYLYATTLKDIDGLIKGSEAKGDRKENSHYLAIGQLLKAYTFATMVDFWGDVPFTEALQGDGETIISDPKFDDDAAIYEACLKLCDDAIVNLEKPTPVEIAKRDLIYNGNPDKWIKFANSLKIKMLMNIQNVDPTANAKLVSLFEAGDYIIDPVDDFTFKFSNTFAPDYRHNWYTLTYSLGDNTFTYVSTEIMVKMIKNRDPRFPFYFRRQSSDILDQTDQSQRSTTPCSSTVGCYYSYVVLNQPLIDELYPDNDEDLGFLAGILGRDRADPAGVPNDGSLRTMPGVYPCGGFYDVAAPALPGVNAAPGRGEFPLLTAWHMKFIKTEAILKEIIAGDAKVELENAIETQISQVADFGIERDENAVALDSTQIEDYIGAALATYDAGSKEQKLNIAMQQFWYASWGSCHEMYNMFRRNFVTSTEGSWPGFLQDPLETFGRKFPLRLPYPQNELSLNANAAAYVSVIYDVEPIFWDANN